MSHLAFWLHSVWHPLAGAGYQFWSGVESAIERPASWTVLGLIWWRHHNCHHHLCPRVQWHPHPDHGHPVCRHHHPDHKQIGLGRAE